MTGRLRLASGLILFLFVLGHFLNHAMGIVSVGAMDSWIKYSIEPWRTLPGTVLLLGALMVHAYLAVWSVYKRRTWRVNRWELLQLVLGFLIPLLIAAHVTATRGLYERFGFESGYAFQLHTLWVALPWRGWVNAIALLVVWTHACMGWHYWLRLKPWYQKIRPIAFSLALLVPALALAGYISGGLRVTRYARSEKWVDRMWSRIEATPETVQQFVTNFEYLTQASVVSILILLGMVHFGRIIIRNRRRSGKILYQSLEGDKSRELFLLPGASLLEHIREEGIAHASVCGGRGRCSTCRIRIDDGLDGLVQPSEEESKVLSRISAPPNVRLACQLYPERELSVTALLKPTATASAGHARSSYADGEEREIAVLFADIRAFTKLSEAKLPYDIAFLLNRYFAAMGQAIEESGGHLDKFIGDGVMALFGIDEGVGTGCQQAVTAARSMSARLVELNNHLENDLPEPLRIGIGIHAGPAIVGNMGYNRATSLTAIGDIVNTASRLESLTKELGSQLVISRFAAETSKVAFDGYSAHFVEIRGKNEPLEVISVPSAKDIAG